MNQTFSTATEKQRILVEYVTLAGSAFAVNLKGETVFINSRIVERMNVAPDKEYDAYLLPNYSDKRDQTPWRAMRLESSDDPVDVEVSTADVLSSLDHDPRAVTVGSLAEDLGITPEQSSKLLTKLHSTGKVSKIAIYISTTSDRASRAAYCRAQDSALLFDWMLDWEEDDAVES